MRMTMVGTGYVGLVTGVCFANTGVDVICLDVDERKIAKLEQGICPIYEPGLTELMILNHQSGRLVYTLDKDLAYRDAEMVFICVGTPSGEDGRADLQYVLQAAADVAKVIKELGPDAPPKTIIVKSTVPVGSTLRVRDTIREIVGPDIEFHVGNCSIILWGREAASGAGAPITHTPFIYVDDLDAHFAHAKAHRAEIIQDIHQQGFRAYEAADPEGNRWTFAQASPLMR